jgi:hypothetical protein
MIRTLVVGWFGAGCLLVLSSVSFAIDFSDFDGAWNFDDAGNRLLDVSGNGNNLVVGTGAPVYAAPSASNNGAAPVNVFNGGAVFNQSGGTSVQTPNGLYTGGSFTLAVAARKAASSGNLSFGSMISSNRFQFHTTDPGSPTPSELTNMNYRTAGGATNGGLDGADFSLSDWNLVILRYNSMTGALDTFISADQDFVDPTPQSGTVGGTGFTGISNFRFGGDGLSGIGGFDDFIGEIDFILFDNSAMTNAQLAELSDFFVNGAAIPEPTSIAIWSLLSCLAGCACCWGWRRNRKAG